jgi:hypothetical protein
VGSVVFLIFFCCRELLKEEKKARASWTSGESIPVF